MTKIGFEIIDEQHIHGTRGIMRNVIVKFNGEEIYHHSYTGGDEPVFNMNAFRRVFLNLHRHIMGIELK